MTAVFSAVVCLLLLVDFARRTPELPLDSPDYLRLRTELAVGCDCRSSATLRELDVQLRQEYFRQRSSPAAGPCCWRVASRSRCCWGIGRPPSAAACPVPAASRRRRPPRPEQQWGLWAVGTLAAGVLLGFGLMPWLLPSPCRSNWTHRASWPTGQRPPAPSRRPTCPPTAQCPRSCRRRPSKSPRAGPVSADRAAPGSRPIADVPTHWDGATGEGIRWKTAVPLPGVNSPVVWEDRVFLTGATAERREVYCFDADSGELLWQQAVAAPPARQRTSGSSRRG